MSNSQYIWDPCYDIIKTEYGDPLFLYLLALQGRLDEMLIWYAAVFQLISTGFESVLA